MSDLALLLGVEELYLTIAVSLCCVYSKYGNVDGSPRGLCRRKEIRCLTLVDRRLFQELRAIGNNTDDEEWHNRPQQDALRLQDRFIQINLSYVSRFSQRIGY